MRKRLKWVGVALLAPTVVISTKLLADVIFERILKVKPYHIDESGIITFTKTGSIGVLLKKYSDHTGDLEQYLLLKNTDFELLEDNVNEYTFMDNYLVMDDTKAIEYVLNTALSVRK